MMHVEFKNANTEKFYYFSGSKGEYYGSAWTPDIHNHLATVSDKLTVSEFYDLIRPVVDRLMVDNDDRWEVTVFYYTQRPIHSLTESNVTILARYKVGDVGYVDGVRQKTLFHPAY